MAALCGMKITSLWLPPFPTNRLSYSFSSRSPISSIIVTTTSSPVVRGLHSPIDDPFVARRNNVDRDESINHVDISNKPSHSESLDYPVNKKKWYIIDAKKIIIERLASAIAYHIMGKDPAFPPSEHLCSYVVVVNAAKVTVPRPIMKTRTKGRSGKPAVLKKENLGNKRKKIPAVVIKRAVWDLLPMRRLGKRIVYHLKVYKGEDHPHEAQLPIKISLTNKENFYSGA